ncbi:oxygen-insensitive NADPH nitroreductase [Bacillus subtilis]|uniref:oxygen-insensitive NADPH nitroreductase n=1 Tax=Bacillus subtilis TaxID=1423 RepID=UPI003980E04D
MNNIIETILNHRSIRSFTDQLLTAEEIDTLVKSAQAASTSSYVQAYSIIGVSDPEKKRELSVLAGNQPYVEKNGHFFVFCADLYRHQKLAEEKGEHISELLENTEMFMVSLIDAALAAQNMSIAAESMGLGICYIGGIRNELDKVTEVLQTPDHVLPLFGLAVGHPANLSGKKPRLPKQAVYHENTYNVNTDDFRHTMNTYDKTISDYYRERTNGQREETWSDQILNFMKQKPRTYLNDYVKEKGFNKN